MIKVNNIGDWILPKEAFDWIYNNIPSGSKILELGSGFGSVALSLNYSVYSIEQDINWLYLTNRVQYIHAPIYNGFYDRSYIEGKIPAQYDLLIIDGPTKASGGRLGFLDNMDLFNLDCPILIDDLHRDDELILLTELSNRLNRKYTVYKAINKKFAIIE